MYTSLLLPLLLSSLLLVASIQVPFNYDNQTPITIAKQTFANRGTTSGWDDIQTDNNGRVSQVTNVVYKGSTSIKVQQSYDASYDGRYHAELHHKNGYKRGEQRFYGFAFRLQEDWQFSPAQSYNIAQFIANVKDTGCDDSMPTSMVWIVGNQLATRIKSGTICKQSLSEFKNLATVTAGVWHTVVIQSKWASDGTGFYKLWFDGRKVLEKLKTPTTVKDNREFEFRVGLYANGWFDDGRMRGTQSLRQIWFDQIAIGTTFADADPRQWN